MNKLDMEVKLYKALAHPTRLAIVKSLLNETNCVCELVDIVGISQSNLSQHIAILRDAGIVKQEREGSRINCLINDPEIGNIVKQTNQIITNQIKKILED